MKRIVLVALAMTLVSVSAIATVTQEFQIQGILTDDQGVELPDGDYSVNITLFDASSGGTYYWSDTVDVAQENGIFTAMLSGFYPDTFEVDLWMELTVEGESPMTPRIPIHPVPVALCAATVDPANAVVRINGKKGYITLVGGNNVTVVPSGSSDEITINADAGAGGDDGDWTISQSDLYHSGAGTVAIGTTDPAPLYASIFGTTMQVSALSTPALCLDRTAAGLERWALYQSGGGFRIGRTTAENTFPVSGVEIFETRTDFKDESGETGISLQTNAPEESGSVIYMYGETTSTPTLVLDGQFGTGGANVVLRNKTGNDEVTVTANYNGTDVGRVTTPVLEITGGSDLSEQFDIGHAGALKRPGMVVCIDPDHPGRLALSGKSYDRKVAGVISGAGGVNTGVVMGHQGTVADGGLPVALVGRVYVWADATTAPIEPGDMLTTSDRPGHAMKVTDHELATGAILGKAMTGLNGGQGLILTLVTLQ